ncbi:MAG: alkyl hydroperoxide reductase [Alphaproteobacteria bacterium RIFCSPHIGHO2_12_FULL_63_12]|nr:MAG: alkyl hydroperoxide reductase [Alphaproteobacteria bacterium RIFCSPHIGHO2_12_FULL_63_12]
MTAYRTAPEWTIAHWLNEDRLNAPAAPSLAALRGKVVMAVAFQMLCPGCVSHGLPQAQRVRAAFSAKDVAVFGLHTVFEHREAQGSKEALAAFLHEYRIGFPVGIDAGAPGGGVPLTMRAYNMQGTPTTILIDRDGRLRLSKFGHIDDLLLGASIATLIGEAPAIAPEAPAMGCDPEGCAVEGAPSS